MDMRGVGYLFMFIVLALFVTDGFAGEKTIKLNNFSVKNLAFQYADEVYEILSMSSGQEVYDKNKIEKLYKRFVLDSILLIAMDSDGSICKTKNYSKACSDALKSMSQDKMQEHLDKAESELEIALQKLSYLKDNIDSGSYKDFHQETSELHGLIPYTYFMKVGSRCGEYRDFFCAYKIKDIIQDKVMGLFGLLRQNILEIYEKKGISKDNLGKLPSLNEIIGELNKNKNIRQEVISNIKDAALSIHSFTTEIRNSP